LSCFRIATIPANTVANIVRTNGLVTKRITTKPSFKTTKETHDKMRTQFWRIRLTKTGY
jgi:hypothetical protein